MVFEHLQRWHDPLLRWYLWRGYAVHYLFPTAPDPDLGSVHALMVSGRIMPLRVPDYPFVNISSVADRAFDATERLYSRLEQRQRLIGRFERLYRSPDVRLVFKKQLLFELTEYFHCRALREQIPAVLPQGAAITFVPIRVTHARLSAEFDPELDVQLDGDRAWRHVSFPLWVRLQAAAATLVARLRAAALTAYSIAQAVRGAALARMEAVQSFDFAIAVVSPLREFANKGRGVDFLLDHARIRRDNTLFVPVVPLPPQRIADMQAKGLTVAQPAGPVPWAVAWDVSQEGAAGLIRAATAPVWVMRTAAHLLREYWVWNSFAGRYRVGQFVTYADFSIRQIGRNILLNREGTQTWYYLDTKNLGALNFHNPDPGVRRHHYWGYLYYDNFVAWSHRVAEYHQAHHQQIGEYHVVGSIWSEHVRQFREGECNSRLRQQLGALGYSPELKLIAVFDSSYNDFSRTTYRDGVVFAEALEKLLEDLPGILIVWKEKKPRWIHRTVRELKSGEQGATDLLQTYARMASHPRCHFAGYDIASSELLASCDIAISFPFTSSTVEALGARLRAIFYAPNEKYFGSYFETIPDLVARRPEELRRLVQKWLYEVPEEEFDRYLDGQLLHRFDPYLDARGLSRFRQLLTTADVAQLVAGPFAAPRQVARTPQEVTADGTGTDA